MNLKMTNKLRLRLLKVYDAELNFIRHPHPPDLDTIVP
jgi:hypothetical protein